MLHAVKRISGGVLWANLHLLFWLSLFPFVTGWMGENHFAQLPTALYGGVLLMAAIAYQILAHHDHQGRGRGFAVGEGGRQGFQGQSIVRRLCRSDRRFASSSTSGPLRRYTILVALVWLVPDRTNREDRAAAALGSPLRRITPRRRAADRGCA